MYHYQNNSSSSTRDLGLVGKGYIDDSSSVLRPFGFGLSYTKFDYRDIRLTDLGEGNIEISVSVENTGKCDGEEIVQLYGQDLIASMIRPIHELIGFK